MRCIRKCLAHRFHQSLDQVVVVNTQRVVNLVFEETVEAEAAFFFNAHAGAQIADSRRGVSVDVVASLGYAEADHRYRKVRQADVAHAATATDADPGEIGIAQLAVDHRQAFRDALGLIAQLAQRFPQRGLVESEVIVGDSECRRRHAEIQSLPRLASPPQ
jgi:hypothetical protein